MREENREVVNDETKFRRRQAEKILGCTTTWADQSRPGVRSLVDKNVAEITTPKSRGAVDVRSGSRSPVRKGSDAIYRRCKGIAAPSLDDDVQVERQV